MTAQAQGQEPILLQGTVTNEKGAGLPGVAVTDGTNIVKTDAKGAYRFYTTGEATMVYLTLPAG
ncbi:MAG: hypothetical protein EOO14_26590, partial [Chitinophagaceae bacterium]